MSEKKARRLEGQKVRRLVNFQTSCVLAFAAFVCFVVSAPVHGVVNPFDIFVSRLNVIATVPGKVVVIAREIAKESPPITYRIKGPTGDIDCFALLRSGGKWYQAQPCTENPFSTRDAWVIRFFEYRAGDRLVPYAGLSAGTTVSVTAYEHLTKDALSKTKPDVFLFGCAPKGQAQAGNLANAHIVQVTLT